MHQAHSICLAANISFSALVRGVGIPSRIGLSGAYRRALRGVWVPSGLWPLGAMVAI